MWAEIFVVLQDCLHIQELTLSATRGKAECGWFRRTCSLECHKHCSQGTRMDLSRSHRTCGKNSNHPSEASLRSPGVGPNKKSPGVGHRRLSLATSVRTGRVRRARGVSWVGVAPAVDGNIG